MARKFAPLVLLALLTQPTVTVSATSTVRDRTAESKLQGRHTIDLPALGLYSQPVLLQIHTELEKLGDKSRVAGRSGRGSRFEGPEEGAFLDGDFIHDANNPLDAFMDQEDAKTSAAPAAKSKAPAAKGKEAAQNASAVQIGVKAVKGKEAAPQQAPPAVAMAAVAAAPEEEKAAAGDGEKAAPEKAAEEAAPEASGENASTAPELPVERPGSAAAPSNTTAADKKNATDDMAGSPCVTRKDPRASAWFAETAPEGTPCVFGVDPADETNHCIFEDGIYGTNGWCWTKADRSEWGSCGGGCPLFGQPGTLGKQLDDVATAATTILKKVKGMAGGQAAAEAPAKDDSEEAAAKEQSKEAAAKEAPKEEGKGAAPAAAKAGGATAKKK